jgi:hypothetical protein
MKWERMNHHVGVSVGVVVALIIFFALSKVAYAGGYMTAQINDDSTAGSNPPWVKFLTTARRDMQATGLDKSVAALDKTPAEFYEISDIIGLIYHNPKSQTPLANYPYFLSLGQRPEFQELASDKEYKELLFTKPAFGTIINHPNTQRLIGNADLVNQLKGVDLKDLEKYLKTGKSKYDEEPILGRWILEKDAVLTFIRKTQPDLRGDQLIALKRGVDMLPPITLVNTIDNKVFVKAEGEAPAEAAPAETTPAPAPDPNADRYRQRGPNRQPATRPTAPPPAAAAAPTLQVLKIAGEGEWKQGATGNYELTINDAAGKPQTLIAQIQDDELTLSKGGMALVFYKAQ